MPKFLDAPSWYDSNGTILSAEGRYVINLTAEDFDTQSETGVARARIDISNLPYGTKGVIYSPSTALATMQYIGIRALSNQTGSLELAYSISTMPFVPYGIFFTISRQATDMNGKTIIFENATIYKNETNLVSLYPSAYSNPVIVAINGTLGRAILVYSGVKVNSFNGDNTLESNIGLYAPTTSGTSGQLLQSSGTGAPTWMANGEEGQVLKMGSTMPAWKSVLYQHTVLVKFNNSSSKKGSFTFSFLDPSAILYDTTQLFSRTRKLQDFDSESTLMPVMGTGIRSTTPYDTGSIYYGATFSSSSIKLYAMQIVETGTIQSNTEMYTKSSITNVYDTVTNIIE